MSETRLAEALQHIRAGDYDIALSTCRDVLERHPDDADALHLTGYLHQLKGEHEDAIRYFAQAGLLAPGNVEIHNNHAGSLKVLGRMEESERYYRRAIAANPGYALAHHNFADLLVKLDRPAEAIARCRAALELEPGLAQTFITLGLALLQQGRYEEALAANRESLARGGNRAAAEFAEAVIHLLQAQWTPGWEKYEARFEVPSVRSRYERFTYPRWRGSPLARRTLLLTREQGLGDEIMFASCFGDAIQIAGRCLATCDARLQPLFARSFPQATFLSGSEAELRERVAGESVDFHLPAGSLPLVFRSRAEDFPAHQGYLRADAARVEHWRARLAALGNARWIGLSWRGGSVETGLARRSLALETLRPLLQLPNARFVSLQYGDVATEVAVLERSHGIRIEHWPEAIASTDETAALLGALETTVSVCTTLVHLAGALGRPACVMVPSAPEWRYGAKGERIPWYPSVRLFRQTSAGDWRAVLERVRAALA